MSAGWWRSPLLTLVLAALPVLAHAPAWSTGQLLAPGDGTALHLPLRLAAWDSLERREVPSWNPWAFSGTPLLAAYRPGALHPLMVALTPVAPFLAFQLLVLLSLALVGPTVYALARRLGAEPVGAFTAGVAFALGPHLVGHLGDTATIVAAPALPLLLLGVEVHLRRPRAASMVLLASATSLVLLAGSRDAVGAAALLLAGRMAVALHQAPGHRWRRAVTLGVAVAAGAMLAGPQLVPTLLAVLAAGPGEPGAAAAPGPAVAGVTGFVVRYLSHTPAPVLALASIPLLRIVPALGVTAPLTLGTGLLLALSGSGSAGGAIPLAFDLALALLAGQALSGQWIRRRGPHGQRLRLLTAVVALFAVAGVSVATSLTGPLSRGLEAPVGLLALALILYVLLGGARRRGVALLFVLPLTASFVLQPRGRSVWSGAPTPHMLEHGTPTRRAVDRIMGPRREERVLSLVESWPRALAADLSFANLGRFAGRRNVEGYDPLVPAHRRAALDGMRSDGSLPRAFLETDPGRLELLGVRWIQVPTASLAAPADRDGLGDRLGVILEPPRPKRFSVPYTRASQVRLASFLADATGVRQGEIVAECVARLASGREIWLPIRAGVHTAEWAWERPDVKAEVKHQRAPILASFPSREGFEGHHYLGELPLPGRFAVVGLRFRALSGAPPLTLVRVGLRDRRSGRDVGVGAASGYLSDEVRLVEVAGTPLVTLFEVRRGVGPARVVSSLRRLPDARRVGELLRAPTRLGVDSGREALADDDDVEGVTLPPGSRSADAVVAQARGGSLVVRANGPGLLVVSEGWDPGWQGWVDRVPTRVLRVNGDRMAVVLEEGAHRVVFRHRAVGLDAGLALALLGAAALGVALLREAVSTRAFRGATEV